MKRVEHKYKPLKEGIPKAVDFLKEYPEFSDTVEKVFCRAKKEKNGRIRTVKKTKKAPKPPAGKIPHIYVACSVFHADSWLPQGAWIDATQTLEGISKDISKMLKGSTNPTHETWVIQESTNFEGYKIDKKEPLENVQELACLITDHPFIGTALMKGWGHTVKEVRKTMVDIYIGRYACLEDYAMEVVKNMHGADVLSTYEGYADYRGMGNDWVLEGVITVVHGGKGCDDVYVFGGE